MKNLFRRLGVIGIAAAAALFVFVIVDSHDAGHTQKVYAQNRTRFAGVRNAYDYAYGINPNLGPLRLDSGNTSTGAGTITLTVGNLTLGDGTTFLPFTPPNTTGMQIVVGSGTNQETVSVTGSSCATPAVYATCQVSATFTLIHGQGDLVSSGTYGMSEAVADAHNNGGGLVAFNASWVSAGGATSQFISSHIGWTNVTLLDYRGTTGATSWIVPGNGTYYRASAVTLY